MIMDDFWNSLNLVVPSFSTYSVKRKTFSDIGKLKSLLEKAIKYFENVQSFYDEISQLSQFIHHGSNQFRMMRGFQEMKKTHQTAKRLKRLDIVNILETFNSYVTDDFESEISIPYRQNLDYLLIKLQGLSKILIRIVICSRKSSRYFLGLIRHGSFYLKGAILVSSLAKIWNLGREMCQQTVILYNNLRPYRDQLRKIEDLKWIADDCFLPEDLQEWLGDEFQLFVDNSTCDHKLLIKPEDIRNFRDNARVTQITEIFQNIKTEEVLEVPKVETFDANCLEDTTPLNRNVHQKIPLDYEHNLKSIRSKENVKLFLTHEDKYRKVDPVKSVTIKKVNKKLWKEIKSDLKNKLALMHENALVEYFHDNINHYLENS